jgi:hypothetical protein
MIVGVHGWDREDRASGESFAACGRDVCGFVPVSGDT